MTRKERISSAMFTGIALIAGIAFQMWVGKSIHDDAQKQVLESIHKAVVVPKITWTTPVIQSVSCPDDMQMTDPSAREQVLIDKQIGELHYAFGSHEAMELSNRYNEARYKYLQCIPDTLGK